MYNRLELTLGDRCDLAWAQQTVTDHHYLRSPVDPRARPMVYVVRYGQERMGLLMLSIPHATKCRGWWGYPGLPTQWQVVDLCRVWLDPEVQAGGSLCQPDIAPGFIDRQGCWRPAVATWAIAQMLERVQRDRIALWPPVYPMDPYHIRLVISYHDPRFHRGTVYRQAKAQPMYTDANGPVPGSSGKYGWCWPLAEPEWGWQELEGIRPRTMRMF